MRFWWGLKSSLMIVCFLTFLKFYFLSNISLLPELPSKNPQFRESLEAQLYTVLHQTVVRAKPLNQQERIAETATTSKFADGWISLFDGNSLFGWKNENEGNWTVKNGEIHCDQGKIGLLRTTNQFDDFTLSFSYFAESDTNSGVFIRSSPKPKNPKSDCYEINIATKTVSPYSSGSLVGLAKTDVKIPADQWNDMRIECVGQTIKVWVNEKLVTDFEDKKKLGKGFIGLQFNRGAIRFKNIHLKPMGLGAIFNGKDLAGWNDPKDDDAEFSVTDGMLHVKGGRGHLESSQSYANFTLQLACRTNAKELNSGIFFRCIPGEKMNGYESQIHNGFAKDRADPIDHGTGGIFRRVKARRVVANDKEWFYKTIIAEGPHISVWVNGYQVTDWQDTRKPDENPRKGLRLKPGTIMIQGHDPTTDIDFRDLKIREMGSRR